MENPIIVQSQNGVRKCVCDANCPDVHCNRAHPNIAGSIVKHPKWCLRGSIQTCEDKDCPFNHFMLELDFIEYRARDPKWAENNPALIAKLSDDAWDRVLTARKPTIIKFRDYIKH